MSTAKVEFTDDQKAAIDRIVQLRLGAERRSHRRELEAREAMLNAEIERLTLESRKERGLLTRVRAWLAAQT